MEIPVRRYRTGDENEIPGLLRTCFDSYNRFEVDKQKWLQYAEIDNGFKPENAVVAEHGGRIVGHLHIVERDVRLADGTYVTAGGIANVATDPSFRGKGIGFQLMGKALEICRDKNYSLSMLFTSYGGVAHRLYLRAGYVDQHFPHQLIAGLYDIKATESGLQGSDDEFSVREYEDGDEEHLLTIYGSWAKNYSGVPKRTLDYWRNKYVLRSCYHTFTHYPFHRDESLVANQGNDIVGYAYLTEWNRVNFRNVERHGEDTGLLREVVSAPGRSGALRALARASLQKFVHRGIKLVEAYLPQDQLYMNTFSGFRHFIPREALMTSVIDLQRLFEIMSDQLTRRLSKIKSKMRTTVELRSSSVSATLDIRPGEIISNGQAKGRTYVGLTEEGLVGFLFGISTLSEQYRRGQLELKPESPSSIEVLKLFEKLMPKTVFHMWGADHW